MDNQDEPFLLRTGGLVESFYVNDSLTSCHHQEGKQFTFEQAKATLARLKREQQVNTWTSAAMKIVPLSKYQ